MKKLLMIAPHLSTGGMPQYLFKQIESYLDEYVIYCVEYNNITGGVLVVQRDKISNLISNNLITLGDNKSIIIDIIKDIDVDIIHFQEIPETFISTDILDIIYNDNRKYNIVVTTHSSYTDPKSIKYTADKFVLVSEWSKRKFVDEFGEDMCSIWEYPLIKEDYNKELSKKELNFDLNKKHILHVGLFTPGKNQKEIIELSKMCLDKDYVFHFVGNQSENFKDYWEPIMSDFPENCIWHGEISDVSAYYKASDIFYFPSLFELNPLSIKEALSYELPIFIKNLETYNNEYDDVATYISNNQEINLKNIKKILNNEDDIFGWFSYEKLYDKFVSESDDCSKIVEIGSWFGKSTNYLMNKIKHSNKTINVDVIDTFKGSLNEKLHMDIVGENNNDIYQLFYDNISNKENLTIIKDTSHNSSFLYKNGEIDFIMIDGDHSYEGVSSDINDFFYKVKPGGIISGDDYNVFDGTTKAVDEFFRRSHHITDNNINWWYRIPRIQVIHISTNPMQIKCKKSLNNINLLERYNFNIKRIVSDVYDGEFDLTKYRLKSNLDNVRPEHYGCYLAHTNALREIDTDNYDYTIIMEEDAFIYSNMKEFVDIVHKSIFECIKNDDIKFISFGSSDFYEENEYDDLFVKAWHQNLAHCYLIPNKHKDWYINEIDNNVWDVADLWYNHIFHDHRDFRLSTNKVFSKQIDGESLIDKIEKKW